jgi:hypothetical protein
MSYLQKITTTQERGASTAVNAWKKLFSGASSPSRSLATVKAYSTNPADLWITMVPSGSTAPAEPVDVNDESVVDYRVSPGDTLALSDGVASYRSDIYIREPGALSTCKYNAWESGEQA